VTLVSIFFRFITINKLSIDVWFVRIGQYLGEMGIWGCKNVKTLRKLSWKFIYFCDCAAFTHKTNVLYIYGRKFPKYLHGKWSLLNILMIFLNAIVIHIPVLINVKNQLCCLKFLWKQWSFLRNRKSKRL